MKFYTRAYKTKLTQDALFPCLVLVINNWDDWGYITTFKLFHYKSQTERYEIGDLKILDLFSKTTILQETFSVLPSNFASLGQSLDYYINLKKIFPENFEEILEALNDISSNFGLRDTFEKSEGFFASLIRFSEAEKVLNEAKFILSDETNSLRKNFNFTYSITLNGADDKHIVEFSFINQEDYPFRSIALIGKNGTGKTQFINNLASSLCDIKSPGKFNPSRPLFSRVIAISFSLFDKFDIPKSTKKFSYKYIGFRQGDEIITQEAINNKLRQSFSIIRKENRESEWFNFINSIIDLKQFDFDSDLNLKSREKDFENIILKREELLSSGQNILVYTITELIANLRRDSIVLFDEPETHLHPNAIAILVKVINKILIHYNSFAIIATHSPIVIQETPSKNVRVFDRIGNTPIIKKLSIESFGENISKLNDVVFYRNEFKEIYKDYFDEEIKNFTIEQINEKFNNCLSLNALLYLNAINKK